WPRTQFRQTPAPTRGQEAARASPLPRPGRGQVAKTGHGSFRSRRSRDPLRRNARAVLPTYAVSSVFRRKAPERLPRHLLFRILAYRLQSERLGDLEQESVRLLDRIASGNGGNGSVRKQSGRDRLQPGSILVREWNGARQRVEVLERRDPGPSSGGWA